MDREKLPAAAFGCENLKGRKEKGRGWARAGRREVQWRSLEGLGNPACMQKEEINHESLNQEH